jgi:hypothetical protein
MFGLGGFGDSWPAEVFSQKRIDDSDLVRLEKLLPAVTDPVEDNQDDRHPRPFQGIGKGLLEPML